MTLADEPLHPATVAFFVLAFFMALLARVTVTHGVLAAFTLLVTVVVLGVTAFGLYEAVTLSRDVRRRHP